MVRHSRISDGELCDSSCGIGSWSSGSGSKRLSDDSDEDIDLGTGRLEAMLTKLGEVRGRERELSRLVV